MDKKESRPESQDRSKTQASAPSGDAALHPQEQEGSLKVHGDKLEKRGDKQAG